MRAKRYITPRYDFLTDEQVTRFKIELEKDKITKRGLVSFLVLKYINGEIRLSEKEKNTILNFSARKKLKKKRGYRDFNSTNYEVVSWGDTKKTMQ